MKSRTATWFECKVRYEQTQEDGLRKMVTEQYVVNAVSFAEAEARITEEMQPYMSGDFEVKEIKIAPYKEIFFMDGGEKVLASETEKLSRAMNRGGEAAMEQYNKETDFNPDHADTCFYKAKVSFITINEKTGKEKRASYIYLVEACSSHNALDNIDIVMKDTMFDYLIQGVTETQIIDVFEAK